MARNSYAEVDFRCVVCTNPIPADRLKYGAITCSPEHGKIREAAIRAGKDTKECRYCRKPSTPEDRAAYQRFRKFEKKRPDLLYPEQYQAFLAAREGGCELTPAAFAEYRARIQEETEAGKNSVDESGADGNILAASTP